MTDSQVQIKIPEQLITSLVEAEIIKALGNQEQLIASVVRSAMEQKDPRGYGRETIFHAEVCKMIREEAETIFRGWIEQNRERIRVAMVAELDRGKAKRLKEIVDGMISRMSKWDVSVNLNLPSEG